MAAAATPRAAMPAPTAPVVSSTALPTCFRRSRAASARRWDAASLIDATFR